MPNNSIQAEGYSNKVLKLIPITVTWAAGTPSVSWNPENEGIVLTDEGAGDLTLTFDTASLVPLKVLGHMIAVADANTLSLECNIDGTATTTVLKIVFNSGADGATETDPVSVNLLIAKYVIA